tara:strand:- start:1201 stop:1446 length:246 start_codon:yes stop_codon:yes gene_type:complete
MIEPRIIPNLNQILFKGVRIFDCNKPKIRKKIDKEKEIIINIIDIFLKYKKIDNNIKNKKNTIPKFLLEGKLCSFILFLLI